MDGLEANSDASLTDTKCQEDEHVISSRRDLRILRIVGFFLLNCPNVDIATSTRSGANAREPLFQLCRDPKCKRAVVFAAIGGTMLTASARDTVARVIGRGKVGDDVTSRFHSLDFDA